MIRTIEAEGTIRERLIEKDLGHMMVYEAGQEVLNKYLSRGCPVSGCGGEVAMICDQKIPELVEGYRCERCGRDTFYDGYVIHISR